MIETSKYHATADEIAKERAVIELAKNNPEKFAALYDNYYEQIFRFVYQRVNEKEQAYDTTQQIFLKALNNLYKYEFRGVPFSAWLYRIASSEVNDLFRKEKAQRTVNIESVAIYSMVEEMEETKIDFYHDKIVEIISALPEDELQLLEMRFFEKRAFKEIAEILDITENNAKVKTYRVIDKLKKIIK